MAMIDEAVIAMLQEVQHIGKEHDNKQQGFRFRSVDDVYNTVWPLLAKHGVYMTCETVSADYSEKTTQKGGVLFYIRGRFRYTMHAKDGSTVVTESLGEAMDSGDKSTGKCMSIGFKYALFQLLCIPTEAIADPDSQTQPPLVPNGEKPQTNGKPTSNWGGRGTKQTAAQSTPPPEKKRTWEDLTATEKFQAVSGRIQKLAKLCAPEECEQTVKELREIMHDQRLSALDKVARLKLQSEAMREALKLTGLINNPANALTLLAALSGEQFQNELPEKEQDEIAGLGQRLEQNLLSATSGQ